MYKNRKKRFILNFLVIVYLFSFSQLSAKPLNSDNNSKGIYKKYIHPREYVFDLCDAKGKVSLKYDSVSNKAYCNADFTDIVKEQMPRKGDKITFVYEGTSSKNVTSITATVYDLSKGKNIGSVEPEIFTGAIEKKQKFNNSFSIMLTEDAEKSLSLHLIATLPEDNKKTNKIDLSFKRVTESTNIKKEIEEEKKAIKNGWKIIRIKSDFEKKEPDFTETTSENITLSVDEVEDISIENENILEKQPEQVSIDSKDNSDNKYEDISIDSKDNSDNHIEEIIIDSKDNYDKQSEDISIDSEDNSDNQLEEIFIDSEDRDENQPEEISIISETSVKEVNNEPIIEDSKNKNIVEKSTYEPIFIDTNITRYKKEYLQDFAVTDEIEMSEDEIRNIKIENPNEKDKNGITLLMKACKNGDKQQVEKLLLSGADVTIQDKDGWTALMYLIRYQNDIECLNLLLEAKANVTTKNKFGLSSITIASCYNTNPQILSRLISFYKPSSKELIKSFIMLISECITDEKSQLEKVQIFIDYSIPLNTYYNGKTPLMYAAQYANSTKMIRLLLENNAKTTIHSKDGKTAFDYAKTNSNLEHDNVYWALNNK